jgi:transposase-like protein
VGSLKKAKAKERKHKFGSIQWVIDALDSNIIEKKTRDNHKMDQIRADESLWWCPECRKKWNIFEGELWKSSDIKLWEAKICPDCDLLVQ